MPLQIVHHPDYDAGFATNHRFPMSKYPLLMEALRTRGLAVTPAAVWYSAEVRSRLETPAPR